MSARRCFCGKQRYGRFTSAEETADKANTEEQDSNKKLYEKYQRTEDYDQPKSLAKGEYLYIRHFYHNL